MWSVYVNKDVGDVMWLWWKSVYVCHGDWIYPEVKKRIQECSKICCSWCKTEIVLCMLNFTNPLGAQLINCPLPDPRQTTVRCKSSCLRALHYINPTNQPTLLTCLLSCWVWWRPCPLTCQTAPSLLVPLEPFSIVVWSRIPLYYGFIYVWRRCTCSRCN